MSHITTDKIRTGSSVMRKNKFKGSNTDKK